MSTIAPPLSPVQMLAVYRDRYPEGLVCTRCGATPAERQDPVAATATAYTCSRCVMPGGLETVRAIKPGGLRGGCLLKGQHPPGSDLAQECPVLNADKRSEARKRGWLTRKGSGHGADQPKASLPACRCQRGICPTCSPRLGQADGAGDPPPDWPQRRAEVLKRDRHRCRHCGTRERLTVHHITPRPTGSHDPRNLVTLCSDCHDAVELPPEPALTPAGAF